MTELNAADFPSLEAALKACAQSLRPVRLTVPAGEYRLNGTLELCSDLTLHLAEDARLKFTDEPRAYLPPAFTRWEGVECYCLRPLVEARHCRNLTIEGSGTIDGCGQRWWDTFRKIEAEDRNAPREDFELELARLNPDYKLRPGGGARPQTQFLRPPLMQFLGCENVCLKDICVTNSPFWTLHFVYSRAITLQGVTVRNPADAINTDALDLDSCADCLIEDCLFDVGDDAVTLKSGSGPDGLRVNLPTEHVAVRGCRILASHGGIAIGSETAGGIRDVKVEHCTFAGTQRAVRLKSRRGRGGVISGIELADLQMDGCWCPLVLEQYFAPGLRDDEKETLLSVKPQPLSALTPRIEHVTIRNVRARRVRSTAAFIVGLPEAPLNGLTIEDYRYKLASPDELLPTSSSEPTDGLFHDEDRGIKVINAVNVTLKDCGEDPSL